MITAKIILRDELKLDPDVELRGMMFVVLPRKGEKVVIADANGSVAARVVDVVHVNNISVIEQCASVEVHVVRGG